MKYGHQAFCSSKNPYGNKTKLVAKLPAISFCSSKNPYGNKTRSNTFSCLGEFCSSKNPYGNKTFAFLIIANGLVLF